MADSEWLPEGDWSLDWSDEFSGEGAVTQWHPMLGYTPTEYLNKEEKGLRWSGSTEDSAHMYSTKTGNRWLNGEGLPPRLSVSQEMLAPRNADDYRSSCIFATCNNVPM